MQFSSAIFTKALVIGAAVSSADAFWRMPCRSRSALARMDPLVNNGTLSSHAHAIHGSGGFSIDAGYTELMASDCTSCEVTQDKSAYWHPAVYFKDSTGKFTLVNQVGGMLAYYLLYTNAGETHLTSFPAGFEMIAGDTNQRNFSYPVPDIQKSLWYQAPYNTQAFLRQAALGFNCLNYQQTPEGSLYRHFLPDKAYLDEHCTDGVRFELMFPSCWNGDKNIPKDKKSHMAYPSEVMTGDCPKGFETRLPSLFYETIWDTYAFKGQDGEFILANGDPTGCGYHGDFMMGWDEAFLQDAVNTCTNPSGQVEDCPLFTLQSASDYDSCNATLPSSIFKENVLDDLSSLPGNPAIAYGPGYAAGNLPSIALPGLPSSSGTQKAPTLSYSAGSSVASTATYVPGAIFLKSDAAAQPTLAVSSAPAATTQAPNISAAAIDTTSYFSTAYTTTGREVIEVLWVEEVVTVTDTTTSTVAPGSKKRDRKRHVHQHHAAGHH